MTNGKLASLLNTDTTPMLFQTPDGKHWISTGGYDYSSEEPVEYNHSVTKLEKAGRKKVDPAELYRWFVRCDPKGNAVFETPDGRYWTVGQLESSVFILVSDDPIVASDSEAWFKDFNGTPVASRWGDEAPIGGFAGVLQVRPCEWWAFEVAGSQKEFSVIRHTGWIVLEKLVSGHRHVLLRKVSKGGNDPLKPDLSTPKSALAVAKQIWETKRTSSMSSD